MGVLDKFLDIMKLSDEEDYDDDFFDDDDDFEDEKPKKGLFKKDKKYDFDDDDDDMYDTKAKSTRSSGASSKVTPMRQPVKRASMEVCVIKPTTVDDAREITETLLNNRTVVLNVEGLDVEIAQRIIDFTSGSTFAISGNLQKISNYIFIITPASVDISGDFLSLVDSFDTKGMRTDY